MVIKGSAAEHDEERLHPATDVEQEGSKRERRRGEDRMCRGKDGGKMRKGKEEKLRE